MNKFFDLFLSKMRSSFRRIVRATRNEVTETDLHSDAWVIAHEIGERRGRAIDFSNPADQDLVIRGVNLKNVRRGDWHLRRAVRIDRDNEHEDGSSVAGVERLPASAASDPLVALIRREAELESEIRLLASYSEAAAYLRTLARFKYNRPSVCEYLAISNSVYLSRVRKAEATVRVQRSLFDGIHTIGKRFKPMPGYRYQGRTKQHHSSIQSCWEF